MEFKKVNPIHGILVFIVVILMLLFVAVPIQMAAGMYGVAITEIILLVLGIVPVFIFKMDFKEVFPIKRPTFLQLLGVGVLWFGSYLMVMVSTLIIQFYFPKITEVGEAMQDIFTSVPVVVSFFIVALMPAICEEVLHRGFILATFNRVNNKWIVILSMGLIFGFFHLDPYRFLPTAILGVVLTYIMIETKNILLPMLFHFINNAVSTGISFLTKDLVSSGASQTTVSIMSIAIFLILGSVIPFLFLLGGLLLRDKTKDKSATLVASIPKKNKFMNLWITLATAGVFIVSGIVLLVMNYKEISVIYETNITMEVNEQSPNMTMDMHVEQSGEYKIKLAMNNERGVNELIILHESGEEVYRTSAGQLTYEGTIKLESGNYTIHVVFHLKDGDEYYKNMGFESDDIEKLGLLGDLNVYTDFELNLVISMF